MTIWLSIGVLFSLAAIILVLAKWWNVECVGVTPVKLVSFVAILFTSGLDVGLIMFPLTEFPEYSNIIKNPEYAFSNPLAIEFGFWGFLVWSMYFLTCFYFCVIEPQVKYFEIPWVKFINNLVVIGTCAFTANLFLVNLPWYLPIGDGQSVTIVFYIIVFFVIAASVYSSSHLRYLRILSLASTGLFFALLAVMLAAFVLGEDGGIAAYLANLSLVRDYFEQIHNFVLPINAYHEFYLYWWFAWSIMIGQFTSRFVGGLKTWQLLGAMMVVPSTLIAVWFAVLYSYFDAGIEVSTYVSIAMAVVGVLFVINSLDTLIRLYTDNFKVTAHEVGLGKYMLGNVVAMSVLTLLFQLEFLKIQWVGALVIGLILTCFGYILLNKRKEVWAIKASPKENELDFEKILLAH